MSFSRKKNYFNFAMLPVIFSLAWPTMLEQLMQTAVQYADTIMVGTLGTAATAAVGSTTTVNWLVGSSLSALGVGFLSYISQAFGAGEKERARKAVSQSVLVCLISGSFFTVLTLVMSPFIPRLMQVDGEIADTASRYFFILYSPMLFRTANIIFGTVLRSAGDTKTPMRVGLIVNAVNVVLNFLLIYPTRQVSLFSLSIKVYGADMGVEGAAAASAAAFVTGGILITAALLRHPLLSPRGQSIKPDREVLAPCLRVALPNMLQRFCTSLGYVFFASMINSLGSISTAAHTVANTVESAFYIPGYGMQTAAATLTGNAVGAGDAKRLQEMSRMTVLCEIVLMIISGGLLFSLSAQMMTLFSKDAEVILLGATVLKMVALSEPFYGVSIVTEGMLQGAGKTLYPFVFNVICMWGVRILGTFICINILGMGLVSAWGCMIANNMLLLVMFRIYYRFAFKNGGFHL
ncbi:MAG: MATE family efflux transporter [Clostridia bacterium]|nr:MATE family efflux transporter [Clostridia bacterium]